MADVSEENSITSNDFASTKAAIFDTFNKLKKLREERLQEFRNRQYLESQRLLRLSNESQKQFEQLLNNATKCPEPEEKPKPPAPDYAEASSVSLANDLDNFDSLHEQSIAGHLQRCFDDSSQSNISVNQNKVPSAAEKIPVFSEIRNPQFPPNNVAQKEKHLVKEGVSNGPSVKPKCPFLRKGTGLLRFMPKSAVSGQVPRTKVVPKSNNIQPKKPVCLPQRNLRLKPAIRKTDVPLENSKHIRFDIPLTNVEEENEYVADHNLSPVSKFAKDTENKYGEQNSCSSLSSSSFEQSPDKDSKSEDDPKSGSENLSLLKERKELEEFEMLEDFAQNSSFNSDSSIVQRILHGDSNKPLSSIQETNMKPSPENVVPAYKEIPKSSPETINFSGKIGLSKCLEEIRAKKQMVQKEISDINPRIQSLQKQITISKQETVEDSEIRERCSTPTEDLSFEERRPSSTLPDSNFDKGSLDLQDYRPTSLASPFENNDDAAYQCDCRSCNFDGISNSCPNHRDVENILNEEEESVSEMPDEIQENDVCEAKSMIRKKLVELQREIDTYQELNEKLSSICKERNEILRKLQKERDDFNKNKEAEKKKLKEEIEEERRQIKRQKETFMRYQKLSKDHPTRKEREEMNALRQEVEKLQEDLKRQQIKYTSDSRRWKNRIETAENERDILQLENIKLEEQCQDLLAALKPRLKKRNEIKSFNDDGEDKVQEHKFKNIPIKKDAESQTETKETNSDIKFSSGIASKCNDSKAARTEIPFKLTPERDKEDLCIIDDDNSKTKDLCTDCTDCSHSSGKSSIATNYNKPRKEVKDTEAFNMSVISVSVESEFKEIEYDNRKERIFATGEKEIIFNSGTRKVISADGKLTKFFFYNGDEKEIFPDKKEIYRYVNGVIEKQFPDGLKITELPNGITQCHYPDGQKEIKFPSGKIQNIYPDGSEKIHLENGKVVSMSADGTKTTVYANGQKEIQTATYKRREFPDGSVKICYNSGKQETRYSNGRIKIKDVEGKVILDTKYSGIPKD